MTPVTAINLSLAIRTFQRALVNARAAPGTTAGEREEIGRLMGEVRGTGARLGVGKEREVENG